VRPGGRLVYATCSLLSEENEAVALAFSASKPEFQAQDAAALLAELKLPTDLKGHALTRNGYLRLWPHEHETDGFFAAVWQRS
jgi:16S rRNA (cytosine967-C5)-methyltransferase